MTDGSEPPRLADERQDLRADCSRCQGLCCVAPAFAKSADFAIDKPAGRACLNLSSDFSCGIHANLRERGFPGCTVFDCFGAGPHVVRVTFDGQDWRQAPEIAASMFAVFNIMRQLKEFAWYLAEAVAALPDGPLRKEVAQAQVQNRGFIDAPAHDLELLEPAAHRAQVGPLLATVSEALRADVPGRGRDRIGDDLIGAELHGADLHGISLRGAYLLGTDLRDANLSRTDLLGADLRGADLRGAHLLTSLFLTQPQLDAAVGDSGTTVPAWLTRPKHWSDLRTPTPGRPRHAR
ncbi:MAG: pentapeptide repeat-containing protein [Actinomycetota bacterium]|nr:pentapeptide repeat-containing protein [Actinomycetota bacterium]